MTSANPIHISSEMSTLRVRIAVQEPQYRLAPFVEDLEALVKPVKWKGGL